MSFDDLRELARRRPLAPFRLYLTDGSTFDVRHPDLFMLGRRSVVIGLAADPAQSFYDQATTVDLLPITHTDPLLVPTRPSGASA